MSKKDFELIADIINNSVISNPVDKIDLATDFADRLAQTNPRFQKDRFLVACEVKS